MERTLATVLPEIFSGIISCPTVSAKSLDPETKGRHRRVYVKLDGVDVFPLGLDEVDILVSGLIAR